VSNHGDQHAAMKILLATSFSGKSAAAEQLRLLAIWRLHC